MAPEKNCGSFSLTRWEPEWPWGQRSLESETSLWTNVQAHKDKSAYSVWKDRATLTSLALVQRSSTAALPDAAPLREGGGKGDQAP